jgi:putative transcriptional regulator
LVLVPLWAASADQTKPPPADSGKSLTALLLVARDELPDPDFADAVVLVMNNLGPAPVGIIVNRPTQVTVSQLFPDLKRLASVHDRVYFGGPVEFGSVWFLFRAAKPPEQAVRAFDDIYLSASRELLLKLLARSKPMEGLRIFVGRSGWAPGQLEEEIAHGAWHLKRAQADLIFGGGSSEHPWPAQEGPKNST